MEDMEMDKDMMRNSLLAELIDQMHGRLADKMFPPNPDMASVPAVSGIPGSEASASVEEGAKVEDRGDMKGDSVGIPAEDDMDDEDIEEMMKGL